jgi:hypothetical protein
MPSSETFLCGISNVSTAMEGSWKNQAAVKEED